MGLFSTVISGVLSEVIKRNRDNKKVKTADPRVFEELEKKVEYVDQTETSRSRGDMYKDYLDKINEAKIENEASTEVETADSSVYDDLVQEIERLKSQVQSQKGGNAPDLDFNHAESPASLPNNANPSGVQAWTNSNGGSLQMRINPDMGSPKSEIRVPAETVLNVIQYSENSVILDGVKSRFALVEYNGHRGWILENYLNFN